jgi:ABC-type sugar transport system substrate-binding protein
VLLNRWSDSLVDLHRQFSHLPVFCISVDQYEVGRIQGRQFKALLPGGGELLYIRGPVGTSSAMRRLVGVREILADTSVRIFTALSDWTTEGGERVMREWLPMLRERASLQSFVVGAQNDSMGIGARRELSGEVGRGLALRAEQVRFTGCDGSPNHGMRWTSEGKLAATVVIPPVAGRALNEVAAMLSGGPRPRAEILLDPSSFPDLRVVERLGGSAMVKARS